MPDPKDLQPALSRGEDLLRELATVAGREHYFGGDVSVVRWLVELVNAAYDIVGIQNPDNEAMAAWRRKLERGPQ